jgi:putative oxidoreductase
VPDITKLRAEWEPRVLSILRIMVGLLYLQHGLNKLFNFAGPLETIGSLFIIFGLFTRPVAFLLSGEMALAYFMAHAPRGFYPLLNGGELAVLYCFIFFYLFVAGGGSWSLDRMRRRGDRRV